METSHNTCEIKELLGELAQFSPSNDYELGQQELAQKLIEMGILEYFKWERPTTYHQESVARYRHEGRSE